MALLPHIFNNTSQMVDQNFGMGVGMDDLVSAFACTPMLSRNYYTPYFSRLKHRQCGEVGSKITVDKEKFQVCLDVRQFSPDEIVVKTVDEHIMVEAKHEEKEDEHGFITRHFIRRYILPKDHIPEDVVSTLSLDGLLTITAPKKKMITKSNERLVPIVSTGPVQKVVEEQPKRDNKKSK